MPGLDWLTARPVAHRGLHNHAEGVIENTTSAFAAAIAADYAIECDVQISADGEAMVHHDGALGRLTEGTGRLDAMVAADLKQVQFRATADQMITLGELCDLVSGRVTLVIELKSRFDGDARLVNRAAAVLAAYAGPAALMSFDSSFIAALHAVEPNLPRGIVAERRHGHREWSGRSSWGASTRSYLRHLMSARPQFVAYSVRDLPATIPLVARTLLRLPLLAWTVRTNEDRKRATRWADQMIFEGFQP